MSVTQSALSTVEGFFSASLAESDPEIADAIRPRASTSARRDRADRVGKHRQPRRARGARLGPDQQIRRGHAGPALLRRLPVRRYCGDARHRTRHPAIRLRLRQRAAAFRRLRQCRSVHGADAARRYLHGPQPRRRRPSHARLAGESVGPLVQGRAVRRAARGPSDRHGRSAAAGETASAQGDHRRRLGLPAHPRLSPLPRDRRRGRRLAHGRHGAFRRARRRRRASFAVPACACGDDDDPQDAARAARRRDPRQRRRAGEEAQFRCVPRHAGRAAHARDRGQGGGVRGGAAALVQALREERRREREGACGNPEILRSRYHLGRHRYASHAGRSAEEAPDRKGGRGGARPGAHHLQQERHSVRSGKAHGHVRGAARHTGRHHAGLRHRRVPAGRGHDRRGAGRAGAHREPRKTRRPRQACAKRSSAWSAGSRSTRGRVKACAVRVVEASIPK